MMFQNATLTVPSAADAETAWIAIVAIAKTHVDTPLLTRLVIGFAPLGRTDVLFGARVIARCRSGQGRCRAHACGDRRNVNGFPAAVKSRARRIRYELVEVITFSKVFAEEITEEVRSAKCEVRRCEGAKVRRCEGRLLTAELD